MNNTEYAKQVGLVITEQISIEQFTQLWEDSAHDNVVLVRTIPQGIIRNYGYQTSTRFHAKEFDAMSDIDIYSFYGNNISYHINEKLLEVTACEQNIYLMNFGDTKIAVRLY